MTEELTAEERVSLATDWPPHHEHISKLLRLYDAALARSEAAEKQIAPVYEKGRATGRDDVAKYSRAIGEIEGQLGIAGAVPLRETIAAVRALRLKVTAAESALAEATEIVRMVDGAQLQGVFPFLARSARAFLSRTPAPVESLKFSPAAEAHLDALERTPAPAAKAEPGEVKRLEADGFYAARVHPEPRESTLLERIEAVIERTAKSPAEPDRLGTWDAVCAIRDLVRASKAGGA
jgi:hypothetical protein